MKHVTVHTKGRPAMAQFEPLLELVQVVSSLLALLEQYQQMFPEKGGQQP